MHPDQYQIRCKINNMRIPPELWFVGTKGVYLDFVVQPLRNPDENGDTHSVSVYDSKTNAKTYIGRGTLVPWEDHKATPDQLPPRISNSNDIEDAQIEHNDDQP